MRIYAPTKRQIENDTRVCARCKKPQSLAEFWRFSRDEHYYFRSYCKSCYSAFRKLHPEKPKTKEQRLRNSLATKLRRVKLVSLGICGRCHKLPAADGVTVCSNCRHQDSLRAKKKNSNLRKVVFDHYGRKCVCAGCNITEDLFLTIDHIGGWGKNHLNARGTRILGVDLYRWLIKNNFPPGFRVLCFNCNCSQAHTGYCPHELQQSSVNPSEVSVSKEIRIN